MAASLLQQLYEVEPRHILSHTYTFRDCSYFILHRFALFSLKKQLLNIFPFSADVTHCDGCFSLFNRLNTKWINNENSHQLQLRHKGAQRQGCGQESCLIYKSEVIPVCTPNEGVRGREQ